MRKAAVALVWWLAGASPMLASPQPAAPPASATVAPQPAAVARADAPARRVRLIATGGTISNRRGGRLTAEELVASVPGLATVAAVEAEQFANTSSAELSLDQWIGLSRLVNDRFRSEPDLAGVVVTSGTDTLEELAYFLHLTVRDRRPVVVTGSMRNPSQVGYEGQANLLAACRVAADEGSAGRGTLVVLNDEINGARDVTKSDALRLHTFVSRGFGALGVVDSDRVVYRRTAEGRHSAASEFEVAAIDTLPRVDAFLVYQGAPGDLIRAAVDFGARGIVLATAGAGALSGTQGAATAYARGKGVIVVRTTRAGAGRIAAGTGADREGRVAGGDLSAVKARVLLMLALTRTSDPAQVQRIFDEY